MKRRRYISHGKNTSCNRISSLDGLGVQGGGNLSRRITDGRAKTSEYAFFQKFKEHTGHNCISGPFPEKEIHRGRFEHINSIGERSIVAQKSPNHCLVPYDMIISPVNMHSFPAPLKCGFPSKIADKSNLDFPDKQMGKDLFSSKRARLSRHVASILAPEFDKLCFKRDNVINALLRRLVPRHEDANCHERSESKEDEVTNNSQQHTFLMSEFADLPWTSEKNSIESFYMKCLEGGCIPSRDLRAGDLVPSRYDVMKCSFPIALQARNSLFNKSEINNYSDSGWIMQNELAHESPTCSLSSYDPVSIDYGHWNLSERSLNQSFDCSELDDGDKVDFSLDCHRYCVRDLFQANHGIDQFILPKSYKRGLRSSLTEPFPCFDSTVLFCIHWDNFFDSSIHSEEDSLCSKANSSSEDFSETDTCLTGIFEEPDLHSFDCEWKHESLIRSLK